MEIAEITLKTLEFPYGSMSGTLVSGMLGSSKTGRNPSLNQPKSDRTGWTRQRVESGQFRVNDVVHGKGSSHSGFSSEIVTLFRKQLFLKKRLDPVSKGSGSRVFRCQKGPDPVKRRPNDVYLRP